jgi:hypothetical protein
LEAVPAALVFALVPDLGAAGLAATAGLLERAVAAWRLAAWCDSDSRGSAGLGRRNVCGTFKAPSELAPIPIKTNPGKIARERIIQPVSFQRKNAQPTNDSIPGCLNPCHLHRHFAEKLTCAPVLKHRFLFILPEFCQELRCRKAEVAPQFAPKLQQTTFRFLNANRWNPLRIANAA